MLLQPSSKRHRYWQIFISLFFLVISILSLMGIFSFQSWQQVDDLYGYGLPFSDLSDHPHFFRFLVAFPGLYLSDVYGEEWFSVYIVSFMILSIYFMYFLLRDANSFLIFTSCAAVFLLHMFMNGRGAISWLGWMMVIYTICENFDKDEKLLNVMFLALALLLCSVSSGTFSVAYAAVILLYIYKFYINFKFFNFNLLLILASLIIISYLFYDLFLSGIERNINYYTIGSTDSFYNMMQHGFGSVIIENPIYTIISLILIFVIFSYIYYAMEKKPNVIEFIMIIVPFAGGVFGYTTMTLTVPSVILVVSARAGGTDLLSRGSLNSGKRVRN
jgi:hypothetical protein